MNEEMHALIREIKQKVLELEYMVYMTEGEFQLIKEREYDEKGSKERVKTDKEHGSRD